MDESIKIRVVHQAQRPDRMMGLGPEMEKMFFDYDIFYAVNPPGMDDRAMCSSCSHVDALRNINGSLLVCEDDVCFLDQGRELFNKAYAQLPEGWDILYLGGNIHEPAERFSDNLFRIRKGVHCNHAILYSDKGRGYVLSHYDLWTSEYKAYDHWLYLVGQGEMECYMMSPIIAYQRPTYSSDGRWADYYMEMRSNELKFLC